MRRPISIIEPSGEHIAAADGAAAADVEARNQAAPPAALTSPGQLTKGDCATYLAL
jgi:hypothetical protein